MKSAGIRAGTIRLHLTSRMRCAGTSRKKLSCAATDPTDDGDQPRGKQSRKPEGIFYTSTSGIWQTVWLEPVPEMCIDSLKDRAGR